MKEKEFIKEIQKLRQIEPKKEWVLMTKKQILGEGETQPSSFWGFQLSQAFVLPLLVVVLVGGAVFIVSQSRVPGDFLYSYSTSVKKINEAMQRQEEDESEFYLNLAEQKIRELKEMAKNDQKEVLASAIQETADIIRKAAESIPEVSQSPAQSSKYVQKVNEIQAGKKEIEEILDVTLGEEEVKQLENKVLALLTNSIENTKDEIGLLVEKEIKDRETKTLSESEREALEEAREFYEGGDYSRALEKLLISGQQ